MSKGTTARKVIQLKEELEAKSRELERLKGELSAVKRELKDTFGVQSLQEAHKKLDKLRRDIGKRESKLEEALQEISKELDLAGLSS